VATQSPVASSERGKLIVHPFARFPERNAPNALEALNNQATFDGNDRYMLTKLLTVILTRRLASSGFWSSEGYSKDDIVVCCVNPGLCRTDLLRRISSIGRTQVPHFHNLR
jgi:NAD(P)-dependent dehydrogenase (short-subunit alcohol dehydrogenase family)